MGKKNMHTITQVRHKQVHKSHLNILLKNLYLVLNPADELGYSAVDAWLVGTPATLAPAYNPCQPPVPFCRLTYQGTATVSLEINHFITFLKKRKQMTVKHLLYM